MGSPSDTDFLAQAWQWQSQWSQSAERLKRSLVRFRSIALGLAILAAVLVTLARQVDDFSSVGRILAWLAAACAAILAAVQAVSKPAKVEDWMRARSVSEAIKSEMYAYLAGVAPYRGPHRATVLGKKVDAVLASVKDLEDQTVDVLPAQRTLPGVTDVASYVTARVQDQIHDYYQPQSVAMKRRAEQFRVTEIALAVVAALLSATAAATGQQGWAVWPPVVTTIAAAVAAQVAVQRYSGLAVEFARTAGQLERLVWNRSDGEKSSPAADDEFVRAAEMAISQQNEAWMARGIAAAKAPGAGPPGTGG
jgi:uncharacterized protein DUF4231/conflict system pore-forming effector with SLATT domain